ncbi:hypothetical protein EBZ80_07730 [bacterium]|nr:hypothetical protein [bacterium]
MRTRNRTRTAALALLFATLAGCDLNHQWRCEWYLMPNPDQQWISKVDEGFIPVCARNLVINRENCDLQATLEMAESHYGKKFRYSDIELDTSGRFPRKVTGFKECTPGEPVPFYVKWQEALDDWLIATFPNNLK